ncbi:MAG: hypothetical protein ACRDAM_06525, partial [Casimicrobium sp.]
MTLKSFPFVKLAIAAAITSAFPHSALAQTCPFDDGNSTLTNEGLVLTRYALGIRGAPLVANTAFAPGDAPTVEATINCPACGLRVTDDRDGLGNPIFTPTDATIISRKIAGLTGTALTDGLALGSGTRNTPQAVNSFLLGGCGATGGTVTQIDSGLGIIATGPNVTNGSFTTSGRIELAFGYILPQGCANGEVPKSNGSGIWTCAPDNVGGGGVNGAFVNGGNAFGVPGLLGTTDAQNMRIVSGGKDFRATIAGKQHGLRITQPAGSGTTVDTPPNVINGHELNTLGGGTIIGATIAGGGNINVGGVFQNN